MVKAYIRLTDNSEALSWS